MDTGYKNAAGGCDLGKIAIMPTSRPLRTEVVKRGKRRQTLNGKTIGELASRYDMVIIGSTASDQFYEYLFGSLPLHQRSKFRLYGRSFFANQPTEDAESDASNPRSIGWMEILRENNVMFEPVRKAMGPDLLPRMEHFDWEHLEDFIIDDRVDVLRDVEQISS